MNFYAQKQAKYLLVHYFRILFEKAGITFTADHQTEVETIIDLIIKSGK